MSTKPKVRVKAMSDNLPRFASHVSSRAHAGGYVNNTSGLGTERDKGTQGAFRHGFLDVYQIDTAYRSSWLARKGVDTPALDMLRQGWSWGLGSEDQEKLDAEWKRLDGDRHNRQALIWSRLHGGAAIYIGTEDQDLSEPLRPENIAQGGVTYLTSIPRHYIHAVNIETDPISPAFGTPQYYQMASSSTSGQTIHHSRIVRYVGLERPGFIGTIYDFWGDSVLEPVYQTLLDFAAGQRGIANILQEASLDVWSMQGFMQGLASNEKYEQALKDRVRIAMEMKSLLNALILDAEDKYDKKPANFANLDDIGMMHLKLVAAAFGMPMTKFLGQAPQGMNSTGEGDERNYYDTLSSLQETSLRPCLEKLYGVIKPSAGLAYDAGELLFEPLRQMTEKDRADIAKTKAETLDIHSRSDVVPTAVLAEAHRGAIEGDDELWGGVKDIYKEHSDENGRLIGTKETDEPGNV